MSETTISNVGTDALVRSVEQGSRNAPYTLSELMVCAAAREIKDGELVFVGMRLPLLAFALAKRTHAPRCVGLFETGILRDEPAAELLYTALISAFSERLKSTASAISIQLRCKARMA